MLKLIFIHLSILILSTFWVVSGEASNFALQRELAETYNMEEVSCFALPDDCENTIQGLLDKEPTKPLKSFFIGTPITVLRINSMGLNTVAMDGDLFVDIQPTVLETQDKIKSLWNEEIRTLRARVLPLSHPDAVEEGSLFAAVQDKVSGGVVVQCQSDSLIKHCEQMLELFIQYPGRFDISHRVFQKIILKMADQFFYDLPQVESLEFRSPGTLAVLIPFKRIDGLYQPSITPDDLMNQIFSAIPTEVAP